MNLRNLLGDSLNFLVKCQVVCIMSDILQGLDENSSWELGAKWRCQHLRSAERHGKSAKIAFLNTFGPQLTPQSFFTSPRIMANKDT